MSWLALRRPSPASLLLWIVCAASLPLSALQSQVARRSPTGQELANLHAFARLYGYVRFFHPSDEAASIDWDRFAILGVSRVRDAANREQLRTRLEALFHPMAPALSLYAAGAAAPRATHLPADTSGLQTVAWQHLGVLINPLRANAYWSTRTNRTARMAAGGLGSGAFFQAIDARPYRGRRVRLRAQVRTRETDNASAAYLWMRVDRGERRVGFFDNMAERPITGATWSRYEIIGDVADDAERIVFGGIAQGMGSMEFDEFELAVADHAGVWQPLDIADAGFEEAETFTRGASGPSASGSPAEPQWIVSSAGFAFEPMSDSPTEGARAAALSLQAQTRTEPLFDAEPHPGEVIDRPLGAGLMVRLPVSLFSDAEGTLPRANAAALRTLTNALDDIDLPAATADQLEVRLADVVILWNVFQHFYPYFDVVPVEWEAELDRSLADAFDDRTSEDFLVTVRRLVAQLGDGHGRVSNPAHLERMRIPLTLEWIEDRIVVTATADSAIHPGDVLRSIDGRSARELLEAEERLTSGSPQWKRYVALGTIGAGKRADTATLALERDGQRIAVNVTRAPRTPIQEFDRPQITQLEPGIWYVDLDRAPWAAIQTVIDSLAGARGVVFDLRGYPAGNHAILQHLMAGPDTSRSWMRIPWTIYPDRERPAGARQSSWNLRPLQPHIGGRVAFITDGRAISYAESVMGYVEGYGLGEIVGAPTAGANGNVNPVPLPGGFTVSWTGMRVVKHDGSQHHLVGIQPTVPAVRTLDGVRAGRDELLEVALRIVRGGR